MAIEPQPDGKRRIGIGLPKTPTPLGIPQIKVKVIDIGRFTIPIHVRVRFLFLPFLGPRPPHRGFLLCDPNQHHPIFALSSRRFDIGLSYLLLVLALLEIHDRDLVLSRILMDGFHVSIADLAKGGRRGNLEPPLPAQEDTHLSHRLKLGHVGLHEDSVDRTAVERHVISQQSGIIRHGHPLISLIAGYRR